MQNPIINDLNLQFLFDDALMRNLPHQVFLIHHFLFELYQNRILGCDWKENIQSITINECFRFGKF